MAIRRVLVALAVFAGGMAYSTLCAWLMGEAGIRP